MAVTHGRVALVTGSSRGLGAVIARRLAGDGFAVAINGRPGDEQVAALGRGIRAEGGTAEGFCADVTDEQQVAGLAAAVAECLGPVDVLVLNATGPQPEAAVTEVGWAELAPFGITVNTVAPGFIPVERHADVPDDCPRRELPRLRRRRVQHWPAHRRRRRPQPRQLITAVGRRTVERRLRARRLRRSRRS